MKPETTIRYLSLLLIAISFDPPSVSSQVLPDSLLRRVVIFKNLVYGRKTGFETDWNFTQATGFYVKPGASSQLYVATAKHVLLFLDSSLVIDTVKGVHIRYKTLTKAGILYSYGFNVTPQFTNSGIKTFYPDSLVDLLLLNQSMPEGAEYLLPNVDAFKLNDILDKRDFNSLRKGHEVVYTGMYPDSIRSGDNYYWVVHGIIDTIFTKPLVVKGARFGLSSSMDFRLKSNGKPGVSGSPVLAKFGDRYKLLGIINMGSAEHGIMFGTAAYRIREMLGD